MAAWLSRSSLERLVGEKRGCSSARWSTALPAHDKHDADSAHHGHLPVHMHGSCFMRRLDASLLPAM